MRVINKVREYEVYLTVSGHSAGGAGYLTRIIKAFDDHRVQKVIVSVEAGEYQEIVLAKIAKDLQLLERVCGVMLNVDLMRVNDFTQNEKVKWSI